MDVKIPQTIKVALLSGVFAGIVLGSFHVYFTEPLIDESIVLEEQKKKAVGRFEESIFSRVEQKIGLFTGSLILGVAVAILFGLIYARSYRILPGSRPIVKGLALAFAAFIVIFFVPSLKYPPNPPGVGSAETIFLRQMLYFGTQVLSVVVALISYIAIKRMKSVGIASRLLTGILVYGIIIVLALLLLPVNPDPITAPPRIVENFRMLSTFGQGVLWLVIGAVYGALWTPYTRFMNHATR